MVGFDASAVTLRWVAEHRATVPAELFVLTAIEIIPAVLGLAFAFLGAKIGQLQAAKNGGTGAGPLGGSTLVALVVGAASLWAASRRSGGVT